MIRLQDISGKVVLSVRLIPKASRDKIVGEYNEALKIQLTAPPVEGAANMALLKFLAKKLRLKNSQLALISGERSKDKKIVIKDVALSELQNKIEQLIREEKK